MAESGEALNRSRFAFQVLEQGDSARDPNGTRIHDQQIASRFARNDRLARGLVRSDAGQPAELQCVGRDVTDRTETERALAEARDQADAATTPSRGSLRWKPRDPDSPNASSA